MAFKKLLLSIVLATVVYAITAQNLTISGSNSHSVMICANGNIYTWGRNDLKQLGVDMSGNEFPASGSRVPVRVGEIGEIFQVDAGSGAHTLAMTCDGKVYAWGQNTFGQLGNSNLTAGPNVGHALPTLVQAGATNPGNPAADLENVIFVSGGNDESFAIWEDPANGETYVIAWGQNDQGQLGNGSTTNTSRPVFVIDGTSATNQRLDDVVYVEAGDENGYALTADGRVWSWGNPTNSNALGRAATNSSEAMPVLGPNGTPLTGIVSISAGDRHCLALDGNGNVFAWGGDWGSGQIGDGDGYYSQPQATRVIAGAAGGGPGALLGDTDPVVSIAAGQAHSIASTASGRVYTWGANGFFNGASEGDPSVPAGQLGIGATATFQNVDAGIHTRPALGLTGPGTPLENVVAVSDGDAWTFAITDDGSIYVAGWNGNGELGIGSNSNANYFTRMPFTGCDLITPCPTIELGPNIYECDRFNKQVSAGLLFPGFAARFYHEGVLIDEDSVASTETRAREIRSRVREFGLYRVEIVDQRPQTMRPCDPCETVFDEFQILQYDKPFDDPGAINPANKLTFCSFVNDAYVEEISTTSLTSDNTYWWFGTNDPTDADYNTRLAISSDEGIIQNAIDTLDLERHPDYIVAGPDHGNDSVFIAWVEDASSYLATAGAGRAPSCSQDNNSLEKTFVLVSVFTDAVLSELSFMQYNHYNSVAADFEVVVYRYNPADPYGQNSTTGIPLYRSQTHSWNSIQGTAISRTIDGMDFELTGSASGTQYWIGVQADGQQLADYRCSGAYPYNDDSDFTVFSITQRNGYDATNVRYGTGITDISLQVGSQYPCDRIMVELTRRCPPCLKPVFAELELTSPTADTILCEGESVTIRPDVSGRNFQESIAWHYYEAAIADTSSANRVPGVSDSLDMARAPLQVNYAGAGTYTLFMYDNSEPDNTECWVAHQITIVASEPPTYLFGDDDQICEGDTPGEILLTFDGTSEDGTYTFDLEDTDGNSYSATHISGTDGEYRVNLPTAAGEYAFVINSYSDDFCPGQTSISNSATYTIDSIPVVIFNDPAAVCEDNGTFSLVPSVFENTNPAVKATGVFSSSNAPAGSVSANGVFNPYRSGDGTFDLQYVYTSQAGCVNTQTAQVTIHPDADVSFTIPERICYYGGTETLSFTGATAGGSETWLSSPSGTNDINVSDGVIGPREGVHERQYTVTLAYETQFGCQDTATDQITVYRVEAPDVTNASINYQRIPVEPMPEMTATGLSGSSYDWVYTGNNSAVLSGDAVTPSGHASQEATNLYNASVELTSDVTFTYEVTQTYQGCTSEPSVVTTIVSACPTPAPVIVNKDICVGEAPLALEATGVGDGNIIWQNLDGSEAGRSSNGATSDRFTPPISVGTTADTLRYQVVEYNAALNCYSPPTPARLVIHALPDVSFNMTQVDFCHYDNAYTFNPQPAGGVFTGDGTMAYANPTATFTPSTAAVNQDIKFVYTYTDQYTCVNADSVMVYVTDPAELVTTGDRRLTTHVPPPLPSVTALDPIVGTIKWYDSTNTVIVGATSATYAPNDTYLYRAGGEYVEGLYTYSVTQTINGCESTPTPATIEIISCPTLAPIPGNTGYCFDGSVQKTVSAEAESGAINNSQLGWFSSLSSIGRGNELGMGSELIVDQYTSVDEYSFYVAEWDETNQCYGIPSEVTMEIFPLPRPVIDLDDRYCYELGGTAPIGTTPTYNPATGTLTGTDGIVSGTQILLDVAQDVRDYTITYEYTETYTYDGGSVSCPHDTSKTIEVAFVEAPVTPDESPFFLLQEDDLSLPAPVIHADNFLTGGLMHWQNQFGVAVTNDAVETDNTYQPLDRDEGIYTYRAVNELDGCFSDYAEVVLQITFCPIGQPLVTPSVIDLCVGDPFGTFTATITDNPATGYVQNGDESIRWFQSANPNQAWLAESLTYQGNLPNTNREYDRSYYLAIYDTELDCYGPFESVRLRVNEVTPPTISHNGPVCDGLAPVQLTGSGEFANSIITWYDGADPSTANALGTGRVFSALNSPFGQYYYWATSKETFGTTQCESNPVPLNYFVDAIPEPPVPLTDSACEDNQFTITRRLTATAGAGEEIRWYYEGNTQTMLYSGAAINLNSRNLSLGDNFFDVYAVANEHLECISDPATVSYYIKEVPEVPEFDNEEALCKGSEASSVVTAVFPLRDPIHWMIDGEVPSESPAREIEIDLTTKDAGKILIEAKSERMGCYSPVRSDSLLIWPVPDVALKIIRDRDDYPRPDIFCQQEEPVYLQAVNMDEDAGDPPVYSIGGLTYGINPLQRMLGTDDLFFIEPRNLGTDSITVNARNTYCSDTFTIPLYVIPKPKPILEATAYYGTGVVDFDHITEQGTVVGLEEIALTVFELDYGLSKELEWDTIEEGFFPVSKEYAFGEYIASLRVTNEFGCDTMVVDSFPMLVTKALYVPNAFAPDVQGEVGLFLPKGHNLKEYRLYIYDSWGNMVFFTDKLKQPAGVPLEPWDGRDADGNLLKSDYYVWKIEASFDDNKSWEGQADRFGRKKTYGNVFLIR